jgi:hypothetical protein
MLVATRLSAREVRLAQILNDGRQLFEAIRAYRTAAQTGRKPVKPPGKNPFFEVVKVLREMAEREGIPIVVIGGVAGVFHGYERHTEDMDIVISPADYAAFLRNCYAYGFTLDTKHIGLAAQIYYKGIKKLKVEVLKGGTMTGAKEGLREIPNPAEMGVTQGLEFVPLERWFQLKIASDRGKDVGDIIELIKRTKPEQHEDVEAYLRDFDPTYAEKFLEHADRARREKERESLIFGK